MPSWLAPRSCHSRNNSDSLNRPRGAEEGCPALASLVRDGQIDSLSVLKRPHQDSSASSLLIPSNPITTQLGHIAKAQSSVPEDEYHCSRAKTFVLTTTKNAVGVDYCCLFLLRVGFPPRLVRDYAAALAVWRRSQKPNRDPPRMPERPSNL